MEHAFLFITGVLDSMGVERTLLFKCYIHRDTERIDIKSPRIVYTIDIFKDHSLNRRKLNVLLFHPPDENLSHSPEKRP